MSKRLANPNFKRPRRMEDAKEGSVSVAEGGNDAAAEETGGNIPQTASLGAMPSSPKSPKIPLVLPLAPKEGSLLKNVVPSPVPSPVKVLIAPKGVSDMVEALSPRSQREPAGPTSPKSGLARDPLEGSGFIFADDKPASPIDTLMRSEAAEVTVVMEQGAGGVLSKSGASVCPKLSAVPPSLVAKPPTFQVKPKVGLVSHPMSASPFLMEKYSISSLQMQENKNSPAVGWKWAPTLLQAATQPKAALSTTLDYKRTVLQNPSVLFSPAPEKIEFKKLACPSLGGATPLELKKTAATPLLPMKEISIPVVPGLMLGSKPSVATTTTKDSGSAC
ncbi:unnamed protein product [Amoebophrya sp. A25]|nr:unnamed protein product [Amoebophrya sp. A25]|eukprot:GSA25T00014600001.1